MGALSGRVLEGLLQRTFGLNPFRLTIRIELGKRMAGFTWKEHMRYALATAIPRGSGSIDRLISPGRAKTASKIYIVAINFQVRFSFDSGHCIFHDIVLSFFSRYKSPLNSLPLYTDNNAILANYRPCHLYCRFSNMQVFVLHNLGWPA